MLGKQANTYTGTGTPCGSARVVWHVSCQSEVMMLNGAGIEFPLYFMLSVESLWVAIYLRSVVSSHVTCAQSSDSLILCALSLSLSHFFSKSGLIFSHRYRYYAIPHTVIYRQKQKVYIHSHVMDKIRLNITLRA